MIKPFAERSHEMMKDVLMDPAASGPDVHYYMIRGGTDKRNVTVWESGTVAGEYIKTYGHYHVGNLNETYWILLGEGILLLQEKDDQGNILSFKAVTVKAGDEAFIPSGIGHLMINVGPTWLVAADDSPVNFAEKDPVSLPGHADYASVKAMRGFAYYVIEKDGMPTFVKNPMYGEVPEPKMFTAEEYRNTHPENTN
jgi:oxalate decarboxylase/phosphoglucose isomerase-like protein (cupin superfamily)